MLKKIMDAIVAIVLGTVFGYAIGAVTELAVYNVYSQYVLADVLTDYPIHFIAGVVVMCFTAIITAGILWVTKRDNQA